MSNQPLNAREHIPRDTICEDFNIHCWLTAHGAMGRATKIMELEVIVGRKGDYEQGVRIGSTAIERGFERIELSRQSCVSDIIEPCIIVSGSGFRAAHRVVE